MTNTSLKIHRIMVGAAWRRITSKPMIYETKTEISL